MRGTRWTQAEYEAYQNRRGTRRPKPQPPVRDEPVGTAQGKATHPGRFRVRIKCLRCRLLDPDNLCPKYFVDCLRYAGIIPDDRPQDIDLEVTQEKVAHRCDERTEIEITPLA